jgi:vitamin B12 transporter
LKNNFPIKKIKVDYTFLNSDKKTDQFRSQYLLDYVKNQLIISLQNSWWFNIQQNWILRYEDRINFEDHLVLDTQISKSLQNFKVFIKVTNLFNKSYEQVRGVPLPGRWILGGIKFSL